MEIYKNFLKLVLQKSNIVLYKTQIGNFTELNMATEKVNSNYRYTLRTNYKHFTKQIKPHDSILKHKEFLIDNFTNMFMSSISFDPEFLMRKLQVAYVIKTTSMEYRSLNVTGLKITYSFDKDIYFVMGADNFDYLDAWMNAENLVKEFKFIILSRGGFDINKISESKFKEYQDHFILVEYNNYVSASLFRKEKDKRIVIPEVYQYIKENNLYEVK